MTGSRRHSGFLKYFTIFQIERCSSHLVGISTILLRNGIKEFFNSFCEVKDILRYFCELSFERNKGVFQLEVFKKSIVLLTNSWKAHVHNHLPYIGPWVYPEKNLVFEKRGKLGGILRCLLFPLELLIKLLNFLLLSRA